MPCDHSLELNAVLACIIVSKSLKWKVPILLSIGQFMSRMFYSFLGAGFKQRNRQMDLLKY